MSLKILTLHQNGGHNLKQLDLTLKCFHINLWKAVITSNARIKFNNSTLTLKRRSWSQNGESIVLCLKRQLNLLDQLSLIVSLKANTMLLKSLSPTFFTTSPILRDHCACPTSAVEWWHINYRSVKFLVRADVRAKHSNRFNHSQTSLARFKSRLWFLFCFEPTFGIAVKFKTYLKNKEMRQEQV